MASRSLNDLAPPVRTLAIQFVAACAAQGLDVLIYCTLRSRAEQAQLYASGRTVRGPVLTGARAGESLHNPDAQGKAWAFDAVPMRAGKALWGNADAIDTMGRCGEAVGLEWAGRWESFKERVHFQLSKKEQENGQGN